MLETSDIQGLVLSGYGDQRFAVYRFCSISQPALVKKWLGSLVPAITNGKVDRGRVCSINVAFTSQALAKFGLGEGTVASFPRAFVEGMSQSDRARLLGDTVDQWRWGKPGHFVDVLVMIFATDVTTLRTQLAAELKRSEGVLKELFAINSEDLPERPGHLDSEEHFGFVDGLSQPSIEGYRPEKYSRDRPDNIVKPGEFLLGYENEYAQLTNSPRLRPPDVDSGSILRNNDLGRNGTYLVLRQLKQDVAGFWGMLKKECSGSGGASGSSAEEALAAKIVGRWRDGTPIVNSLTQAGGNPKQQNSFGFETDPLGHKCPFGAHIRRGNPRATLLKDAKMSTLTDKRHRLLRRGRVYGPQLQDRYRDDGVERGLVFVTLNANIERQFEFVQHAWITSPNFAGLYDEADPLLGGRTQADGVFTIPKRPVRELRTTILPHITVVGGAYFFLPSMSALSFLAS